MLWSWYIIFQQKNKRIWCARKISISNHRRSRKQRWLNFFGIIYFVNYCLHHFLFLHQACWSYQYVGSMSYMNLVYCMTKSWALRSSEVGASDRCLEGHRFNYCRGIRFFLCPVLLTFWLCHFSKILSCYLKITIGVYGHKSLWHSLGIYRYLD